jgi:hypothetical protein
MTDEPDAFDAAFEDALDLAVPESLAPEPEAVETPRMGVLALSVDLLLRPASAMSRLSEHPGRRWIWPLLALLLVRVATVIAQTPARSRFQQAVMQAQLADQPGMDPQAMAGLQAAGGGALGIITAVLAALGVVFTVIVGAIVVAGILHFAGTVMGGQQSFQQVFTVTSWAHLPLVIGGILQFAQALMGGFDPCPSGLAGLVCADPMDKEATRSFLEPFLAQIELWNLWYLLLLAIGVMAVSKVSRRKAAAAVGVVVSLSIAAGLAGVALARWAGETFG